MTVGGPATAASPTVRARPRAARRLGARADLGRLGLAIGAGGLAIAGLALAGAVAGVGAAPEPPTSVEIEIRFSRFEPATFAVPAGRTITITIHNADPIDHEWIVGDDAVHARHRTGTEPVHDTRPTEVTIPAGGTATTTVTFPEPGRLAFVCHLPGHEAYGMVGAVRVVD